MDILYDGRSFMQSTRDPATGAVTEPTYSSEGLLHALRRQESPTALDERFTYLYFAGRPVAQLELHSGGGQSLRYLVTDHLGTPVVALDETGAEVWDSGFEPFGRDAEEASPDGALANEVFLRFPGQWEDGRWAGASMGAGVFYNVHRWYQAALGAYTRPDPQWAPSRLREINPFLYVAQNPTSFFDLLGLIRMTFCCNSWDRENLPEIHRQVTELQGYVLGSNQDPGPLSINPFGKTECTAAGSDVATPDTTYTFSPGICANACVRVHEQRHRDDCRTMSLQALIARPHGTDEGLAYGDHAACLQEAMFDGQVTVDVEPLGPTNRVTARRSQ